MFRRDVQNLADVLNLCLRRNGLETPLLQHRLVNAWDRVVGPGVVAYTGEKFIKNQTLMVKIKNPALRQDLSMMKQRLITRLNGEVGSMIIILVNFLVCAILLDYKDLDPFFNEPAPLLGRHFIQLLNYRLH